MGKKNESKEAKPGAQSDDMHLKQNKPLYELVCLTSTITAQTQGAHWNYTGRDFIGIHKLLDEHYHNLAQATDDLAERLRALNEFAPATMKEVESVSRPILANYTHGEVASGEQYLSQLIHGHELMTHKLTEAIDFYEDANDVVTHDILIKRKEFHDKSLWMLRSCSGDSKVDAHSDSTAASGQDGSSEGSDKKFFAPALSRTGVYI